jgi:hypothetical protein
MMQDATLAWMAFAVLDELVELDQACREACWDGRE